MATVFEDPPLVDWPAVLADNIDRAEIIRAKWNAESIRAARRAVIEEAVEFDKKLADIAEDRDISFAAWHGSTSPEKVIMAGHQPVIYHPGLLRKVRSLSESALAPEVTTLNIILDTDQDDAGIIRFPRGSGEHLRIAEETIASGGSLLGCQKLLSMSAVRETFARIESSLRQDGYDVLADRLGRPADVYTRLAEVPIGAAHSIVRSGYENRRYREIPFSKILKRPEVQALVTYPLRDIPGFTAAYNSTLDEHRKARKIKNPANPFPNLKTGSEGMELPFWIIDERAGTREVLVAKPAAGGAYSFWGGTRLFATLSQGAAHEFPAQLDGVVYLAPRGGWISAFFRLFLCDVFVHGRGGGKYDLFTDSFLKKILGAEPPRFCVTSETSYLFPDEAARIDRAEMLKEQFKDLISHTEKFLGTGTFDAAATGRLCELVPVRATLLDDLKKAQGDKGATSAVAHKLNALNREIRAIIEASSVGETIRLLDKPEGLVRAWKGREFPYFLYADSTGGIG